LVEEAEIAVVGLGLAGSAAAWALSRRGRTVVGFDAYDLGHRHGSSHGHSRIFRRAYLDPLYVELTGRAGALWREVEAEAGQKLLTTTGGFDHGPRRRPEQLVTLLRDHGVAAELLEPEEAARRRPGVVFDGKVVYDPEGAVFDPERAMATLERLATTSGAYLMRRNRVRTMQVGEDGVRLETDAGTWRVRTVVVAAGAWTEPLLAGLVELPPLRVTQQQVFFFRPYDPDTPWPTLIHDDGLTIYALPEGELVKISEHLLDATATTATARDFLVDPESRERVIRYVERFLPGLNPLPVSEMTCLYTSTANEDFIIDRRGPIVVCSPCSGHGAKFTPLIGELVADRVDGLAPAPGRFSIEAHRRG
jgi:sarcosine oxidase